jgi:hypothetical protein
VSYATPDDFICSISDQGTLCLLASHEPVLNDADIGLLRQALVAGFCDATFSVNETDVVEITGAALEPIPAFVGISKYPTGFRITNPNDETSARFAIGVSTTSAGTGSSVTGIASGSVTNPAWAFTGGQLWIGLSGVVTNTYPALAFDVLIGNVIDATIMLVDNDEVIKN